MHIRNTARLHKIYHSHLFSLDFKLRTALHEPPELLGRVAGGLAQVGNEIRVLPVIPQQIVQLKVRHRPVCNVQKYSSRRVRRRRISYFARTFPSLYNFSCVRSRGLYTLSSVSEMQCVTYYLRIYAWYVCMYMYMSVVGLIGM